MAGFRDIKRAARQALHRVLQIPALYILDPADLVNNPAVPVAVRLHISFNALGDVKGTSFSYAERHELGPRIIFLKSEVTPVRGAVVSIESGEAYRIDNVLPPDDFTVTAEVAAMRSAETAGLPVPVAS